MPSLLSDRVEDAVSRHLVSARSTRQGLVSRGLVRKATQGFSQAYLRDFDWSLRVALSSEKLSKLREPLLLLSLYLKGYDRFSEYISHDAGNAEFTGERFREHQEFAGEDSLAVYLKDIELEIDSRSLDSTIEIADCQGSDCCLENWCIPAEYCGRPGDPVPVEPALCGDEIVQDNEQCDGSNLNGWTCESLGFSGGSLRCGPECLIDWSGCND